MEETKDRKTDFEGTFEGTISWFLGTSCESIPQRTTVRHTGSSKKVNVIQYEGNGLREI
ncbi:hypothetical protein AB4Z29_15685 [Paenibacillus sp. 2TAB23]|uniref:hypothetical protein n=1 Tax=Paenibacillus sp. 2TAB23 TaxID=3233004 RepID=UPI003F9DA15B